MAVYLPRVVRPRRRRRLPCLIVLGLLLLLVLVLVVIAVIVLVDCSPPTLRTRLGLLLRRLLQRGMSEGSLVKARICTFLSPLRYAGSTVFTGGGAQSALGDCPGQGASRMTGVDRTMNCCGRPRASNAWTVAEVIGADSGVDEATLAALAALGMFG